MPSFTLSNDSRFTAGVTLYCYPAVGSIPSGASVDSAIVQANGTATFDGLSYNARYLAGTNVNGPFVAFRTDPPPVASGSLPYVATEADLPAEATLGQVVLVLEDSTNLDENDNPQATLRYGNGTEWALLGLAGGGTVDGGTTGDFIVLDVDLTGRHDGDTLLFEDTTDLYVPGGLS